MNNSPTGESTDATASQEPTVQAPADNTAESQSQETISHEQSQEAVSTDTAQTQTQTQENESGGQSDDDGLAKFAKSQGFDPENLSDDVKRALKIAHDNQKAYRNSSNSQAKITDTTKQLGGQSTEARLAQLEYERTADKFFSDGRDKSLEPEMVKILNEKVEQLTPELGEEQARAYAFSLSRDLPTLYDLASLRANGSQSNVEAIRREERESIKRQQTASAGQAHAVTQSTSGPDKIDREWLSTKYDPSNPEHKKLVDAAVANGDL